MFCLNAQPLAQADDGGGKQGGLGNKIFVMPPIETGENEKPGMMCGVEQFLVGQGEDADGIEIRRSNFYKFLMVREMAIRWKRSVADTAKPESFRTETEELSIGSESRAGVKPGHAGSLGYDS